MFIDVELLQVVKNTNLVLGVSYIDTKSEEYTKLQAVTNYISSNSASFPSVSHLNVVKDMLAEIYKKPKFQLVGVSNITVPANRTLNDGTAVCTATYNTVIAKNVAIYNEFDKISKATTDLEKLEAANNLVSIAQGTPTVPSTGSITVIEYELLPYNSVAVLEDIEILTKMGIDIKNDYLTEPLSTAMICPKLTNGLSDTNALQNIMDYVGLSLDDPVARVLELDEEKSLRVKTYMKESFRNRVENTEARVYSSMTDKIKYSNACHRALKELNLEAEEKTFKLTSAFTSISAL